MEVNELNLKDIENRLKSIVKDNNFKLRKGYEIEDTIKILEFILIEIAKSNDALGDVSYLKEYYSELFEDNRYSLFMFESNCNELDKMIENHRDMFALFFKDFRGRARPSAAPSAPRRCSGTLRADIPRRSDTVC